MFLLIDGRTPDTTIQANPVLPIIFNPSMSEEEAISVAKRKILINRIVMFRPDNLKLNRAISDQLQPGVVITFAPDIPLDHIQEILARLKALVTVLVFHFMSLDIRQQILCSLLPMNPLMFDPSAPVRDIQNWLALISPSITITLAIDTPAPLAIAISQAIRPGQSLLLPLGIPSNLAQAISYHLAEGALLISSSSMPSDFVEKLQPNRWLGLMIHDCDAEQITPFASRLCIEAGLIIFPQNPLDLVIALASGLKPGSRVQWHIAVPYEAYIAICRHLKAGVILELIDPNMTVHDAKRIASVLSPNVVIRFALNISAEIQAVFLQRQTSGIRFFPLEPNRLPAFDVTIPHRCDEADMAKIKTYFMFELGEQGSFYDGLNELDKQDRMMLLDYLIGKYSEENYTHPDAVGLEIIIKQLDGGYGLFNDLKEAVSKIAPSVMLDREELVPLLTQEDIEQLPHYLQSTYQNPMLLKEIITFVVEQLHALRDTTRTCRI